MVVAWVLVSMMAEGGRNGRGGWMSKGVGIDVDAWWWWLAGQYCGGCYGGCSSHRSGWLGQWWPAMILLMMVGGCCCGVLEWRNGGCRSFDNRLPVGGDREGSGQDGNRLGWRLCEF
ncbi:vegetative cell wall protein gp1-like [Iris pallida]|uniref:Vegetative cell wall protein gp1-like n=1 Tax=Iris pallida TaxID=29817 RepID=A0AAX6FBM6_IRIPA|nr:vegetative cell wall protein gp1-like [Iris pallida]KAJ6834303.1 vegetative cell wall protein gp1-like [Iris pallida]